MTASILHDNDRQRRQSSPGTAARPRSRTMKPMTDNGRRGHTHNHCPADVTLYQIEQRGRHNPNASTVHRRRWARAQHVYRPQTAPSVAAPRATTGYPRHRQTPAPHRLRKRRGTTTIGRNAKGGFQSVNVWWSYCRLGSSRHSPHR